MRSEPRAGGREGECRQVEGGTALAVSTNHLCSDREDKLGVHGENARKWECNEPVVVTEDLPLRVVILLSVILSVKCGFCLYFPSGRKFLTSQWS